MVAPVSAAEATGGRGAARAAAKRTRARRGAAIAAISTLVVIGGLAILVLTSPG